MQNEVEKTERPGQEAWRPLSKDGPVAVMDSGLGGISVLRELISVMPEEDYLYFGDSVNAPYGEKPPEVIRELCRRNVEMMLARGAKCVVIACNTATSAAAEILRQEYPFLPVIGMEPAVKPAAKCGGHPRVLVLATPLTIKGDRLHHLVEAYADEAEFILREAPGIVRFVEEGVCDAAPNEALREYLSELLAEFSLCGQESIDQAQDSADSRENVRETEGGTAPGRIGEALAKHHVDAVVLGCTHFPFVKRSIVEALGYPAAVYDGARGTALQTRRRLLESGLLRESGAHGKILLLNSDESRLPAERMLLELPE